MQLSPSYKAILVISCLLYKMKWSRRCWGLIMLDFQEKNVQSNQMEDSEYISRATKLANYRRRLVQKRISQWMEVINEIDSVMLLMISSYWTAGCCLVSLHSKFDYCKTWKLKEGHNRFEPSSMRNESFRWSIFKLGKKWQEHWKVTYLVIAAIGWSIQSA